jgi:hypothetical protein
MFKRIPNNNEKISVTIGSLRFQVVRMLILGFILGIIFYRLFLD